MTIIDKDKLKRAAQGTARQRDKTPGPLTRADFREATVVALDPSLSATGMVVVRHGEIVMMVLKAHTFKLTSELTGHEKNYDLAEQLYQALLIEFSSISYYFPGATVVHEAPLVGGGKISRPESSMMAGREVRRAAIACRLPIEPMISPRQHKELITGDRQTNKSQLRAPLKLLADALPIEGYDLVRNEATRDGLSVALAALHRRGE